MSSYLRAFDEIETDLEDFDIKALSGPSQHPDAQIKLLIAARQRVGRLRRSLAPHRDVFAALGHSEFDPLSSRESSQRFVALTAQLDAALAAARDVKDAIASSFDVLIVRTEHRTNEIVKVLTLVSILLLRGADRRRRRDERELHTPCLRGLNALLGRRSGNHRDRGDIARARPRTALDLTRHPKVAYSIACAGSGFSSSPLTDSNRRPPPYLCAPNRCCPAQLVTVPKGERRPPQNRRFMA